MLVVCEVVKMFVLHCFVFSIGASTYAVWNLDESSATLLFRPDRSSGLRVRKGAVCGSYN